MSKIEWTEKTWNPTTGCTKVSAGCKNCYAETMHKRLNAMGTKGYDQPFSEIMCHSDRLDIPLKRKKPTTYFVNSMSDLFHKDVAFDFIVKVFNVIHETHDRHKFQILTKNVYRLEEFLKSNFKPNKDATGFSSTLWIGVSVENKKNLFRAKKLQALKRHFSNGKNIYLFTSFLSIEPLLEDLGDIDLTSIDWVIVGGESGNNARPMKKEWVLNIKRQCKEQGVLFFFKQWGAYGEGGIKRNKKANGCLIDGVEYKGIPHSPEIYFNERR